jgi:hypothetical protein
MAEMPPIKTTVDPKLTMTSAEQAMALDKAFDDTFGPLGTPDAKPEPKPEPKPAAPRSEPASASGEDSDLEEHPEEEVPLREEEGTETSEGDDEAVVSEPADRAAAGGHPDDEPDEEIDKFKLHPETRPESLNVFRELRGMLKAERKKARELSERIQKAESAGPRPVNDPAVQREIEELRQFRQKHAIFDDSTYQSVYENPVHEQFNQIISDIKSLSNDPAAAEDWEKHMRSAGPDRLNKAYWNEGVISQIADPLDRDRLVRKVSTLMELQQRRDAFRKQAAEQPDAYEKFRHEQAAQYWANFGKEAEDEVKKMTPVLGEWAAPKDLKAAKNATEKAAIEAHNAAYKHYEQLFERYIREAATEGPRGMARISALAVQSEKRAKDLESANKRIAKLKAERDQAREELNKISGARSRVSQPSTAGTNGAPAPQGKRKASQSVDSAFTDFFGKA